MLRHREPAGGFGCRAPGTLAEPGGRDAVPVETERRRAREHIGSLGLGENCGVVWLLFWAAEVPAPYVHHGTSGLSRLPHKSQRREGLLLLLPFCSCKLSIFQPAALLKWCEARVLGASAAGLFADLRGR